MKRCHNFSRLLAEVNTPATLYLQDIMNLSFSLNIRLCTCVLMTTLSAAGTKTDEVCLLISFSRTTGVLRSHGSRHGGCRRGNRVDQMTCELMPRFQTLCKNEWKMTALKRFGSDDVHCMLRDGDTDVNTHTQVVTQTNTPV